MSKPDAEILKEASRWLHACVKAQAERLRKLEKENRELRFRIEELTKTKEG